MGPKIGPQKVFIMEDFGMFSRCCVSGSGIYKTCDFHKACLTSDFAVFVHDFFRTLQHGETKRWQQTSWLQIEKTCETSPLSNIMIRHVSGTLNTRFIPGGEGKPTFFSADQNN